MSLHARLAYACLAAGLSLATPAYANFFVFSVGGDDTAASIQGTVDAFRAALGDPLNGNAPGPLDDGRREINWDGGGSTVTAPGGTPFTVFRNSRGATFTTAGTGFLQTPTDTPEFLAINPTYDDTFGFFSPVRVFTAVGSNIVDATFTIPGHPDQQATVSGFGAVFSDVDLGTSASLTFFDILGNVLFSQNVEAGSVPDGSLSFLGAIAQSGERIARVRLVQGTSALGPTDNPAQGVDMVVFDDYLYAEPQGVPEPATLGLLLVAGFAALGASRRRAAKRSTT